MTSDKEAPGSGPAWTVPAEHICHPCEGRDKNQERNLHALQ